MLARMLLMSLLACREPEEPVAEQQDDPVVEDVEDLGIYFRIEGVGSQPWPGCGRTRPGLWGWVTERYAGATFDVFIEHDKPEKMYEQAGLDAASITQCALAALGKDSVLYDASRA